MSKVKIILTALFITGGLAMGAPYATHALQAQDPIDPPECIYGSYMINEVCNGPTIRCCKCKIGCPINQE